MPWLTTEGASHQIADGETVVGSGQHAGWRLSAQDLAARHFVVKREGGRVTIKACGVDAIIAINGAQPGSAAIELRNGDTIDAGKARFLFSNERSGSYPAIDVGPAHLVESRTAIAHALGSTSVGIGRDRLNSVVVRDPTASRFHAEIRREAGGYVIHPHGSSGTFVNGRRVGTPSRLKDGDRVEIGNVELRFVAGPVPEGARLAEPIADDEQSHRPTVIQSMAMEIPAEDKRPSLMWVWVVVGVVAAATVWFISR